MMKYERVENPQIAVNLMSNHINTHTQYPSVKHLVRATAQTSTKMIALLLCCLWHV